MGRLTPEENMMDNEHINSVKAETQYIEHGAERIGPENKPVLVTGAGGYIAMECIRQLLEAGYQVRGTLRNMERAPGLLEILAKGQTSAANVRQQLQFVQLDLLEDASVTEANPGRWAEAMEGCQAVLHVASPFPLGEEIPPELLIRTAQEGTLRVLQAATQTGVRRVVLTSSAAAVGYGHPGASAAPVYDASHWTNLDGAISTYTRSKTLAERAAWDFVRQYNENPASEPLELVVINPTFVQGPALDARQKFTSAALLRGLLTGAYPALPQLSFCIVDVRDVAAAHLAALTAPDAPGKRFIVYTETLWMREIAAILAEQFKPLGYRIPKMVIPTWLTRFLAQFIPEARAVLPELGRYVHYDTTPARTILNWQPRPVREAIIEMAESLIEQDALISQRNL